MSLVPELQSARCMSNRYKNEDFPRCVSCTRRWAGDTCRFQKIRYFIRDDKNNLRGMSFSEAHPPTPPAMNFPTEWNRTFEKTHINRTKVGYAHDNDNECILTSRLSSCQSQRLFYRPYWKNSNISKWMTSCEEPVRLMFVLHVVRRRCRIFDESNPLRPTSLQTHAWLLYSRWLSCVVCAVGKFAMTVSNKSVILLENLRMPHLRNSLRLLNAGRNIPGRTRSSSIAPGEMTMWYRTSLLWRGFLHRNWKKPSKKCRTFLTAMHRRMQNVQVKRQLRQ